MAKSLNLIFEQTFKISTTALRLVRVHPDIPRDLRWKLQFFIFIGVFVVSMFVLCYSIFIHDIKSEQFTEAYKNGAMVIVSINIIYKYLLIFMRQKDIQDFIMLVNNDYSEENNYSYEAKYIVQVYANKGVIVGKVLLIGGIIPCFIFPLKAFVCMAYYYWIEEFRFVSMFELTLPEPMETYKNNISVAFWMWFVFTLMFDIFTTIMYIGFDSLVPIFLLHVCGQIVLLCQRLDKLFIEFEDTKQIEEELKIIAIKMQSLYKFVDRIKDYFCVIYECNMKTSTFLLSFFGILIVQDFYNVYKNPEFVIFFCGSILHFFIPCYYSDLLMDQSENFRQAIYSSGWQICPHKGVRQIILILLTKASTPMGIKTIFYRINLETFAEMCSQAYAIFNLINASL